MHVLIYTVTSEIRHEEADGVEERGSFLCVFEGATIYNYNLTYITHYVESPYEITSKDL